MLQAMAMLRKKYAHANGGGPGCPDRHWPDQKPTACWHTLPAWDSPVSAVALKDGCSASSLTTSSPVYPLAPSTAMRWVFLVDPFEPAMLGLLGACRSAQAFTTAQKWLY